MRPGGLFRLARKPEGEADLWVCGPFEVLAETSDEAGGSWGLLLRVAARDGAAHELAAPRRSMAGDGLGLHELLADCGLSLNPAPSARQALLDYLNGCASLRRAHYVPSIGWHRAPGGPPLFLLPDEVFGHGTRAPQRRSHMAHSHFPLFGFARGLQAPAEKASGAAWTLSRPAG